MTTSNILLLLLSVIVAGGLSFYQYYYKAGSRTKVHMLLAFLRFFSIFGILLLLINPMITTKSYVTEKTPLPLVIDNSGSVAHLGAKADAEKVIEQIMGHKALNEKFDVQSHRIDADFESTQEFAFDGTQTNLEKVAANLQSFHKNKTYPTLLVTDGNQTSGSDFVYSFDGQNKVFPIILGDTTTVTDLRITRVNVNKYAFLKNKFPVEVFVQYSGSKSLTASFAIQKGSEIFHRQSVSFSPSNRSAIINVLLPANQVGLQVFKASVSSSETEKNTYNNVKNFAVDVIDQKTEVAIISDINHPDIGALKRSIETNSQRKVTIVRPKDASLQGFDVLILYQPTQAFQKVFENNKTTGINTFIITGTSTDFNFLNQRQSALQFRMSSQKEDYLASYESQFNLFALDDIGFESYPPLTHSFGTVKATGNVSVLLSSRIRNITSDTPLLAFSEDGKGRTAYLLGEHLWKWRVFHHTTQNSFEKFDVFTDKIIQFLSTGKSRKSLIVTHENFYNAGDAIEISAQFFNKNFEFDEKARLTITATNRESKATKRYDLLKTNKAFKVNLDGLAAGQYDFSVRELNSNTTYKGYFEILDFDIEKQFVNPDVVKLSLLAQRTNGEIYLPSNLDNVIGQLLNDELYKTIQREVVKKEPLIEQILLLILICSALAVEWFTRKYHGLI